MRGKTNRTIQDILLFLPLLFASCQPFGTVTEQPDLPLSPAGQILDSSLMTDDDALLDQQSPERVGGSFDPENPTPNIDLPEEPLTEEDIAFFKGLLGAIITESEQEEATCQEAHCFTGIIGAMIYGLG
jgi:hypothetical protein